MLRFLNLNIIDVIHKIIEESDLIKRVHQSSNELFKYYFWFNHLSFSIYMIGEYCELIYYPRTSLDYDLLMKPFHSQDPPTEIRFESIDFINDEDQAAFHELYYLVSNKMSV